MARFPRRGLGSTTTCRDIRLSIPHRRSPKLSWRSPPLQKRANLRRSMSLMKQHEADTRERYGLAATHAAERATLKQAHLANSVRSLDHAIAPIEDSKSSSAGCKKGAARTCFSRRYEMDRRVEKASHQCILQAHSQVDPNDPGFKYHSEGITDTLNQILVQFIGQNDLETERDKTVNTFTSTRHVGWQDFPIRDPDQR